MRLRKLLGWLGVILFLMGFVHVSPAQANVTYTYVGVPFNDLENGAPSSLAGTSMTATFTFSSTVTPGWTGYIGASDIVSWSVTVGDSTLSSANSSDLILSGGQFDFTGGAITAWDFQIAAVSTNPSDDGYSNFMRSDFWGGSGWAGNEWYSNYSPASAYAQLYASTSGYATGNSDLVGAWTMVAGPSAPITISNVQAAPGNTQAAVSFNVAASSDTATPFTYTVTGAGSDLSTPTATGSGSPIVVTGLTNGVSYTFTVTATDSNNGTSPASSASNSVTPAENLYTAWVGTWNLNFIFNYVGADVGQGYPLWNRCSEQIDANGTISSGSCTDSNGTPSTYTGATFLFPYGMVPVVTGNTLFPNIVCQGSIDNTFTSCTATLADGSGSTLLSTGSLQAASYPLSDIAGTWYLNFLDPGPNGADWTTGTATFKSNGDFQYSSSKNGNKPKSGSGVMSVSPQGVVTCTSGNCKNSNMELFMDAGLTTLAGTDTESGTDAQIYLFTKKASSYSLADLAGLWNGNQLASDGTWKRMTVQVNPDGSATESAVYSDGSTDYGGGKLLISPTGDVTCAKNQSHCKNVNWEMDAGKTIMAGAQTSTSGSTYSLQILTKAAAPPAAPTDVSASVSGAGKAIVNFTAPTFTGGSAITGYTVTSDPSGGTDGNAVTTSTTHTVSGLKSGTVYTFTVTATNAMGLTSASSKPSNKITTWTGPGKPAITSLTAGNAMVTVKFTEPKSTTGGSISYTVTSEPGGFIGSGNASPITVGSLQNGTAYTFTVKATNGVGSSVSQPSKSVTPATVPGAPTIGTATAGAGGATVTFTPVTTVNDGGSPVEYYIATSSPGNFKGKGTSSPITVKGLSAETQYSFTVTATNKVGTGSGSGASNVVTPEK